MQWTVGGGGERSSLPRGQPPDSELQTNPAGLDGPYPHGQHGPGYAGSVVRFRKIGRLRFATLQHRETDSATSWPYPSFVGVRGDRQQQHQVRMISRVAAVRVERKFDSIVPAFYCRPWGHHPFLVDVVVSQHSGLLALRRA